MKRDKEWPRPQWMCFAVCGLIVCVICFVVAVEVLPADFKPPARWGVGVDSAKWFVTLVDGTHWDSSATTARSNIARYDSTFTGLSNDTGYLFTLRLWDGSDSASNWVFYWPVLATATISGANMATIADSVDADLTADHGAGSWTTGGAGSGSNAVRYYAVDTSGTDEAIMEVQITMTTIVDVFDAAGPTNANGYRDFTAPTDSMIAYGRKLGYYFPYDTNDITGTLTDTLLGYNVPLQASPDPNLCRVQGYVYVPEGATKRMIKVTFTVVGEAVHNDCDGTAFIAEPVLAWTSTHDDSLGFFYVDLIPSGCLLKADGDSLQYKVTQDLGGVTGKEKEIWVPQEESYEVDW